ncbi:MAG: hypothetical protein RLZZ540_269 [Bacteroidota bacterium]|jgi:hypothetical protein
MAGENINRRLNIYINGKEVENSLTGVTSAINKTRNELGRLKKDQADYDSEVKRLTDRMAQLRDSQAEFREELQLNNKELGAARENFANLLGGLVSGDLKAIQTGMLAIRGSIVATTQAAWAFVATPVGAFIAVFAGLGLAAKQVADFNEEIKESNALLDNLGVDTKLRPAIQAIADTYKVGFESIANAVDNMVDLGLVKDEFEALEQIKEGLVKAPDKNAFLSMLDANGVAAKNLGLQLKDVISLNESFEATGANADAVFGALQKSSSTLILQSPKLKKALENSFGSAFTSELLSQVKTGEITYYEALDRIHKKGEEIGLSNQKQAQLARELFGKSAIAAGGYEMILGNVSAAQKKQTQALTETQKQAKKLAESNIEVAKAQDEALRLDGYNRWKNNALLAINWVKTAWYSFISGLVNNEDDIKAKVKKEADANLLKDKENMFNDYMNRRKKRLGDDFNWEKERAEHLADVVATMKSNKQLSAPEKKAYYTEIEVIKRAKKPVVKQSVDGPSEEDTKDADKAAKKREKELSDAKKHSEDLLKEENDLQNALNESRAKANELKFGLIKDEYTREKALINAEYDKKIEDLELNIKKEQQAIDKLKTGIASPKTSDEDLKSFKKQLKERQQIQENYNQTMLLTDQTRDLKLGALHEKFLQKEIQKKQDANARELQNLQTKHANELTAVKTLQDAKAILYGTLSSEELKEIHSLEEAKKKVKQQFQNEELTLQQKHLTEMIAQMKTKLGEVDQFGIPLISTEERETILKFLDDAASKLANLGGQKSENSPDKVDASKDIKSLSGLDILGFTPEQWQNTFDSLDTFSEKIAAVEMVIGAVQNAFGSYFQFLEAGDKRTLQKFESNTNKKKAALSDQLEKGFITQEVYNARTAKLDQDLAKKKAEIEYKQAKREKLMNITGIIANTAVGVSKALAQGGMLFGVPFAGIVAALGGVQLALALAQPLPDKNGFQKGGYTGDGNPSSVSTALGNKNYTYHKSEYVVPSDVLFSNDPVVPNIVGYLENKRQGKTNSSNQEEGTTSSAQQTTSVASQDSPAMLSFMARIFQIFDKLEKDGFVGFIENDIKTARKMRDKIKELEKLEKNAKA